MLQLWFILVLFSGKEMREMRRVYCFVVAAMAAGLAVSGCGGGGGSSGGGSSSNSRIVSHRNLGGGVTELTRADGTKFLVSLVVSQNGVPLTPSSGVFWVAAQSQSKTEVVVSVTGLPPGTDCQIGVWGATKTGEGRWSLRTGIFTASFDAEVPPSSNAGSNYRFSNSVKISVDTPVVSMVDEGKGVIAVTRTDGSVTRYTVTVFQSDSASGTGNWTVLTPLPDNPWRYAVKTVPAGATTTKIMIRSEPPLSLGVTAPGGAPLTDSDRFSFGIGEYDITATFTVGDGAGTRSISTTFHLSVAAS
jgi:hypothetical protein